MITRLCDKSGLNSKQDFLGFVWQVVIFGIVGCSNTVISLVVYWVLCYLGMHYIVSFAIGEVISILNAYIWSSLFVFRQKEGQRRNHGKAMVRVFVIYLSTFLLAELLLYVQVDCLSWNEKLAPVLNLLCTIPINFLLNKFWAFEEG